MQKIYLGFIDYARTLEATLEASAYLHANEIKRLESIERDSSRRAFLAGRSLIKSTLATLCGISPALIELDVEAGGKPWCSSHNRYHFSLSHSHGLAAIAISEVPIGLDLEEIRLGRDLDAIAKAILRPEEQNVLTMETKKDKSLFYVMWTLKEAWLKLHGLGLNELSHAPSFLPGAEGNLQVQNIHSNTTECYMAWHIVDSTGNKFILSIAIQNHMAENKELVLEFMPSFSADIEKPVLQFEAFSVPV